jgi:hypothetical protein
MDEISFEITYLEIKYSTLSKETRAQITFPQYVALRYPGWSKDEVLHWIILVEEKRARDRKRWEEQRDPTPIRSTQRCYSCKAPWEPDHRCRGKGQKHIIEECHTSDDEACEDGSIDAYLEQSDDDSDPCTNASDSNSCTGASDSCTLEDDGDPCVVDRQSEEQWDRQDDNTCISADISHGVDDPTPQQSGDTSGDSHVLAPRSDQLPMRTVTPLSPFQAPTIATSHEDTSSMSDMMEEPCVRDAPHGRVDPLIQEEVQDVHTVDLTHTDQHEEIESQLWETPLVEQIVETNRLREHLLPGSSCSDEDALLIIRDDHSTCLDTSIWDPGADDSSRVSAQEDTASHTGYSVIQREIASSDGMQWHTGGPSNTVDSG